MPSQTTRFLFVYDDNSQKISARQGEDDAPSGILRKLSGEEIRTQFFFSKPALSNEIIMNLCRQLFDYSEWIITCPQSWFGNLSDIIKQFFGDEINIRKADLPDGESEHWNRLLNDNFDTLTRKASGLTFSSYQILETSEEVTEDTQKLKRRLNIIDSIYFYSRWIALIGFLFVAGFILKEQFHVWAKITGQEFHCYYNKVLYPYGHENSPEYALGERIFQFTNTPFQWIALNSDSLLLTRLESDTLGLTLSLQPDTLRNLIRTRAYLRSHFIILTLKKDFDRQPSNHAFNPKPLYFGYLGYSGGESNFDSTVNLYGLKTGFKYNSYTNIPQQFEQAYCDILMASKKLWGRAPRSSSGWMSNFRIISSAFSDTLFKLFQPLGRTYYDFYKYVGASEARQLAGLVGVITGHRRAISPLLTRDWTEVLTFQSLSAVIKALRRKEIGSAIIPAVRFYAYLSENASEDLVVAGSAGKSRQYAVILNSAQPSLVNKLNSALEVLDYEVSRSGIYQDIFRNQYTRDGKVILEWFPAAGNRN